MTVRFLFAKINLDNYSHLHPKEETTMKKLRSLSRLACAFAFCLLALCLLPSVVLTANAESTSAWKESDNLYTYVYGNGDALVIEENGVYVDTNRNGKQDDGNEPLCQPNDMTIIYGGAKEGNCAINVKITVNGGELRSIRGSNRSGQLTGTIDIEINGGKFAQPVCAGGGGAHIGNANIVVNDGALYNIYALSGAGTSLTGNCNITVKGGTVPLLSSVGSSSTLNGNCYITVVGGKINNLRAISDGTVTGVVDINVTGGSISDLSYFYEGENATVKEISIFIAEDVSVGDFRHYANHPGSSAERINVRILNPDGCTVNSYSDPIEPATSMLVRNAGGDWIVKGSVEIPAGHTLTIPAGSTLTIPEGATLTNNGTIVCGGTLVNKGTISNNGSFFCSVHTYILKDNEYVCQNCGAVREKCAKNNNGAHTFTYTADESTKTITQTCANNCGHVGTAQLTHPSGTAYVGTTAEFYVQPVIKFSIGWIQISGELSKSFTATGLDQSKIWNDTALSDELTAEPRTVTATMSIGNVSVSMDIAVEYLPLTDSLFSTNALYVDDQNTHWYQASSNRANPAVIKAADGYKIYDAKSDFSDYVDITEPENGIVTGITYQIQRESDGALTGPATLPTLKWEDTAPWGRINISTNAGEICGFSEAANPDFSVFLKEGTSVDVDAGDYEGSGIKEIAYFVASEAQEKPKELNYTPYTNESSILLEEGKHIVYARITDNVGNVTYINTHGIVVYEDATIALEEAERLPYNFGEGQDMPVSIVLNGNTVDQIKLGNVVLEEGKDYACDYEKNRITLKKSLLNSLSVGDYTLTISFNPLGVSYGENAIGDAPADCSVKLTVVKMPMAELVHPTVKTGLVYAGQEHELINEHKPVAGTYEYAIGTDDTNAPTDGWSTSVPKAINAGSYHVWYRATPNDTDNYEIIEATYIGEEAVVAPAPAPDIVFPIAKDGITYGQPLKDVALTDSSNAFGTFAWAEPELILDAGEAKVALDFIPNALSLQNYNWENPGEGITWIQEENVLRQRVIVPIYKAQSKIETAPTPITGMIYNGEERALVNAGTAVGGIVAYNLSVDGNGGYEAVIPVVKNAGNYTVWYKVIGDSNHTDSQISRVDIQISKADPAIGAVTAATVKDTTDLSAVVLTRANETIAGTLTADAGQTLALGTNTVTYTFTPVDAVNYITATGFTGVTVVDTIPPTGEVTLSTNSWKEFLNNVTFGKFFKETQTLKVTAADSFSGVAKVEYAESSKALDLAAVQAITDWKQMDGSVSVTAEDAKRFVYYVRITDKSGNVTYLSSDGAEFDTSAPVITGISEGVTYHTTQTVTVTDKNLDTVTLNGKTVTAPVSLPGNKEATYTVTATDKAGNTATITVKMASIAQISGDVADKTTQTVTTADAEKLEQILAETEELLKDETLPAEEKAALEKTQAEAQALLNQVEASLEVVRTEAVENTLGTTADNVQLTQKEEIREAIETIETALETYASNYTADDKQQMQAQLDQLKAAATAIENVENVQKSVSQLPAAVEPDDEAAEEKILAAKAAYDAMTEYEKTLAKAEGEKLTALLTALTDYRIVKGNGAVFNGDSLTFTANGAYKKFKGLLVNGITVDPKYYTAKSGSTIITLSEDYLKTLKGGTHTITVLYTDGETSGTFSVTKQAAAKPNVPDTGDHAAPLLWTLISIGTLSAALLLADRKRRYVK